MDESILLSIKKMLGISKDNTDFDTDIIIHINTVLMILNQIGVGKIGYSISDLNNKWSEFLDSNKNLEPTKTYVYLKVKNIFDPPLNSSVSSAMNNTLNELEWRLNSQVDYPGGDKDVELPTN